MSVSIGNFCQYEEASSDPKVTLKVPSLHCDMAGLWAPGTTGYRMSTSDFSAQMTLTWQEAEADNRTGATYTHTHTCTHVHTQLTTWQRFKGENWWVVIKAGRYGENQISRYFQYRYCDDIVGLTVGAIAKYLHDISDEQSLLMLIWVIWLSG